jgi:hypothetical protein
MSVDRTMHLPGGEAAEFVPVGRILPLLQPGRALYFTEPMSLKDMKLLKLATLSQNIHTQPGT